jgi:hypothetical protein
MATTRKRPAGQASSLPPQIKPLSRDQDVFVRMIVYGEPGVGKTPFAASAPNALILDGDGGLESAIAAKSTAKKWTLDDWNDATEAYEYLKAGGHKDFEWLVLDSITLFQEKGLDMIMEDLVAQKPHRKVYLPDKGEYGQNMNRLGKFLRDIRSLPINQVWTAHAAMLEIEQPDGSVVTKMMPAIQGRGMSQKICGYVAVVAHLESVGSKKNPDQEYPVLSTRRRDGWYGKDRYGAIGRMPNPTIPKVVSAIEAKLDPSKATKGE